LGILEYGPSCFHAVGQHRDGGRECKQIERHDDADPSKWHGTRVEQIADTRVRRDPRCCPGPTSHLHSGSFDRAESIEREAGRRGQWCDFRFERPIRCSRAQNMVDVVKHGDDQDGNEQNIRSPAQSMVMGKDKEP
jgi:hypothetical protein